jgi:hypothetical protein
MDALPDLLQSLDAALSALTRDLDAELTCTLSLPERDPRCPVALMRRLAAVRATVPGLATRVGAVLAEKHELAVSALAAQGQMLATVDRLAKGIEAGWRECVVVVVVQSRLEIGVFFFFFFFFCFFFFN